MAAASNWMLLHHFLYFDGSFRSFWIVVLMQSFFVKSALWCIVMQEWVASGIEQNNRSLLNKRTVTVESRIQVKNIWTAVLIMLTPMGAKATGIFIALSYDCPWQLQMSKLWMCGLHCHYKSQSRLEEQNLSSFLAYSSIPNSISNSTSSHNSLAIFQNCDIWDIGSVLLSRLILLDNPNDILAPTQSVYFNMLVSM